VRRSGGRSPCPRPLPPAAHGRAPASSRAAPVGVRIDRFAVPAVGVRGGALDPCGVDDDPAPHQDAFRSADGPLRRAALRGHASKARRAPRPVPLGRPAGRADAGDALQNADPSRKAGRLQIRDMPPGPNRQRLGRHPQGTARMAHRRRMNVSAHRSWRPSIDRSINPLKTKTRPHMMRRERSREMPLIIGFSTHLSFLCTSPRTLRISPG